MKVLTIASIVVSVAATTSSAQQVKPENQIKYRKAAYTLMNLNFGGLAAMAEGKRPFNRDEAARHADFVAMLATVPKGFFGEGTSKDTAKDTRAKPEIWTKRPDFDAKMEKMVSEAAKLPAAARSGDMEGFKKQVGDTAAACKACHDDYRIKSE